MDKVSVHSYGQSPYNFTSQKLMLAPATEIVYDNQAYTGSAVGGKNPILQNIIKWHVLQASIHLGLVV